MRVEPIRPAQVNLPGGAIYNPLRSEQAMFRLVVGVGIACAIVIAVALVLGALAGAIVLAIELCAALVALWRSRGA